MAEGDTFGCMVSWGEVSVDVEAVRLAFEGKTVELTVTEQVYLFVSWQASWPAQFPQVTQYRVAGQWIPPSS